MSGPLRRISLVGVPGVGKTSLITWVSQRLPHIYCITGSSVLRELAGTDFNEFDRLDVEKKGAYREAAIDWMLARQLSERKDILCDGHCTLLDDITGNVCPIFTARDCEFFRELILVEAPPEVVLARRVRDTSRRRNTDLEVIAKELSVEHDTCIHLAKQHGMTLHMLAPNLGAQTLNELLEILS